MRVLPVNTASYGSYSKFNNKKTADYKVCDPNGTCEPSFKGGKSILGGFVLGVVGTVALSAMAPLAILGAGVVGIGGALLGDSLGNKKSS